MFNIVLYSLFRHCLRLISIVRLRKRDPPKTPSHSCLCVTVCCCSFKTSKNDHVIEVKLYDDIDFMCPYYPSSSSASSTAASAARHSDRRRHLEFYVVYMVSVR